MIYCLGKLWREYRGYEDRISHNIIVYNGGLDKEFFSKEIDSDAYNAVAKINYMIIELFGEKMFPEHLDNVQKAFNDLRGNAVFLSNKNTGMVQTIQTENT